MDVFGLTVKNLNKRDLKKSGGNSPAAPSLQL